MMRLRALISFPTSLFLIALCLVTVNAVWYYPSCPKNGCQCVNSQPKGGGKQCCCVGKDIREIPVNLSTSMNTLLMSEVGIERISATDLLKYPLLEQIDISNAKALISVNAVAFDHLTKLRKLSLSDCPNLREIEGTLLEKNPKIQVLTVAYTALEQIPSMRMTNDHYLTMQSIDFSNNKIQNLTGGLIQRVYTKSFRLDNNQLTEIGSRVFNMCKFVDLNLSHNRKLTVMSKSAFEGISVIHNLNLSDTSISELPTEGIKELKSIDIRDTSSLKQLPSILAFTTLQEAKFTYPYHCCLFKHAKREAERSDRQYTKNLAEMQSKYCEKKTTSTPQAQKKEPLKRQRRQVTTKSTANAYLLFELDYFDRWGAYDNETVSSESEESSEEPDDHTEGQTITVSCHDDNAGIYLYYENITCTPEPNALNPCEDVVGYTFLRFAIWVVWIFAIVGNIGVWAVLIIVKHPRMKVHYFFMMNLALADLLTGVYLAMLAIQDIRTSGEYYNYAVEWQTGMGCKVAGFISVFASELSIITMFLISFEIWYNTKYVFYGKRLHQYAAWILMFLGYIYATLMAALPLLGVSSYSPTSICLPLKISSTVDRGYIISGLIFNIIAFCGMATNYGMIYCTMNGSASRSTRPEDIQVAKKMALLIGTDFLCWCPTILFGLTAALKMPLINISVAKIFLVLFYPINAFTNPFLYVFMTKIIRTDIKNMAVRSTIYKKISERHSRGPMSKSSSFNPFYYNPSPPGSVKRQRHPSMAQSSTTFLQVTQTTSVGSTPRGSTGSSNTRNSAHSLETLKVDQNQQSINAPNRATVQRVSFDDDVIVDEVDQEQPVAQPKRKSFPIKARVQVSAVPQMSDISENSHSSDEHHPLSSADAQCNPSTSRTLKSLVNATSSSNDTTIRNTPTETRPLIGILANGRRKRASEGGGDDRTSMDDEDEWWGRQNASSNGRQSSVTSSGIGSMRADSESSVLSQKLDGADSSLVPLLSMRRVAPTALVDRCSISPSIESGYSGRPDAADNHKMHAGRSMPILMVSDFSANINEVSTSWV